MRRTVVITVLLAGALAVAQQEGSATTPTRTEQSPGQATEAPRAKGADHTVDSNFSAAAADALMARLAKGLVRKNAKVFLSAFYGGRMDDYSLFADRIAAMLDQSDSFRSHYHVLYAAEQDGKGSAAVEFEVERMPQASGAAPDRKRAQLRLECERDATGAWRIVRLSPPDFFMQL